MSQGITIWTHIAGLIATLSCILVPLVLFFRSSRGSGDDDDRLG